MTVTAIHPDVTDEGRDLKTESWLDGLHVQWTFQPEMKLTDVDQEASIKNQARLEALDMDVVDRYTADMERGDRFPPLLALKRSRRKPMLLGGNHRFTGAVKAERSTLPAYIVEAEPEMATRLMYEDNRRHGLPPSDDERIHQAVHLIDTGWTVKAAAQCVGVAEHKINSMRASVRAERRARTLDVVGFQSLARTAKARLDGIRSDPVFAEACKLVIAAGLTGDQMQTLVSSINGTRSDSDALSLIGAETEVLRATIQKKAGGDTTRRPSTPRDRMLTAVANIGACDPGQVAAGCANKDQAQSLARPRLDVNTRLDATVTELRRRWP